MFNRRNSVSTLTKPRRRNRSVLALAGVAALGATTIALSPLGMASSFAATGDAHPFTAGEAQQIHEGKIVFDDGSAEGLVDTSLIEGPVLDPKADNDHDGIPNDQELLVYSKDGRKFLQYRSHPLLADTDGDGIPDGKDSDPLSWNLSTRDAILLAELSYGSDEYVQKVLTDEGPLPQKDWRKGRRMYALIRNELSPYWRVKTTWHTKSGMDVDLFSFSNKKLPFLKDGSTNMIAFRGTDGSSADLNADARIVAGFLPDQARDAQKIADELAADPQTAPNLSITGHSLGGYLAQVFLVRSVGQKYGDSSVNPWRKNWNYWDTYKHNNAQVKQLYSFNGICLRNSWFAPYVAEYRVLNDYLTDVYHSKYYQISNDPLVPSVCVPKGADWLPAADGKHSSTSFFEDRYIDQPGFSVGLRRGMSENGYRDPQLDKVRFVKAGSVKPVNSASSVSAAAPETYPVIVEYYWGGYKVGSQNLQVAAGQRPTIVNTWPYPGSNRWVFKVPSMWQVQPVSANTQVVKVPVYITRS